MRYLVGAVRLRLFKMNIIVFILISLVMTLVCDKIPSKLYDYKKWMFRVRKWEHGGLFYEKYLMVKKWKSKLPDISDFVKWRFNKKHLAESDSEYLSVFLTESCKSEFTHWMIILSTVIFAFWNDSLTTFLFFVAASLLNLPYIIIQRYNRPRLIKLLRRNKQQQSGLELSAVKI